MIIVSFSLLITIFAGCISQKQTEQAVDTDGDGYADDVDAFPNDPTEWKDSDGDGVGDNSDAFPYDPTETKDSDNDGVGDNSDAFPYDPTEWKDSDNDGVGDNADAFPYDSNEQYDSDKDGVGDNSDAFPNDPTQWADRDGDGYGDNPNGNNPDAFPDDPTEWKDTDGDGIGDNTDIYDYGNGAIKVEILSYQGENYADDEGGLPDPYFIITVWTIEAGEWKYLGGTTTTTYVDTDNIYRPSDGKVIIDVNDDIPFVIFRITAYDKDTGKIEDDIIDINGTSSDLFNVEHWFYPSEQSFAVYTDDGRLDLSDEMDGIIEYEISVVSVNT